MVKHDIPVIPLTYQRKIGRNRGRPRIWLEGKMLATSGWVRGTRFTATFADGRLTYTRDPAGPRGVAGSPERPIIDTNNGKIGVCLGESGTITTVQITPAVIVITPSLVAAPPIGIPYARNDVRDGVPGVICPVCDTFCPQTGNKDFESVTTGYAAHYAAEHADEVSS